MTYPTFAIIGCGPATSGRGGAHSIAYAHGEAARRLGVPLVAAASRTAANREGFAEAFPGCRMYADWRTMLAEQRPQLVSICAFPPDREAMALGALAAGAKALWIEKPFAMTLAAADRILAVAEQHGARVFVNHQRRYGAPFQHWQRAVAGGRIGRLLEVHCTQQWPGLVDFGSHLIDLAQWLLEPRRPVHIQASATWGSRIYQGWPSEDRLLAQVVWDDGARLVVSTGDRQPGLTPVVRALGDRGVADLILSPGNPRRTVRIVTPEGLDEPDLDEDFHHGIDDGVLYIERALKDLVRAVTDGGPTLIDGGSARAGLALLLGILDAAKGGREEA
jgi:UDP-N-acetylglucosamine 3-dehydrogenase